MDLGPREGVLREHYLVKQQLAKVARDVCALKMHPDSVLPFLQAGRLVQVVVPEGGGDGAQVVAGGGDQGAASEEQDFGWGVVVDFRAPRDGAAPSSVEVLVSCLKETGAGSSEAAKPTPRPCPTGAQGEMRVVRVALAALRDLSAVRIYLPKVPPAIAAPTSCGPAPARRPTSSAGGARAEL